jgi:hypothetical protein
MLPVPIRAGLQIPDVRPGEAMGERFDAVVLFGDRDTVGWTGSS